MELRGWASTRRTIGSKNDSGRHEGSGVVLGAELGGALEQLGLAAVLLAQVAVQAQVMEEVVALKDAVLLDHP